MKKPYLVWGKGWETVGKEYEKDRRVTAVLIFVFKDYAFLSASRERQRVAFLRAAVLR